MTILIKGIEMPPDIEGAEVIIHIKPDGTVFDMRGVHLQAQAVEVPTPHGRLVDADALMELYEPAPEDANEWEHYTTTISVIRQNIKDAPTVIEAGE